MQEIGAQKKEFRALGGRGVGWGYSLMAYTWRCHTQGVPFSGYRNVKARVDISLVDVYKRVGKSVISICIRRPERSLKELTGAFMVVKMLGKFPWFEVYSHFKRHCICSS